MVTVLVTSYWSYHGPDVDLASAIGKDGLQVAAAEVPVRRTGSTDQLHTVSADRTIWRSQRVCGVNCLYFLLRVSGKTPDYVVLQDALLKEDLTSLYDLQKAAARHGMTLRLARITPDELRAIAKPVIAHLDVLTVQGATGGHFVVVTHADEDTIRYVDGTTAETHELSWHTFEQSWSGFVAHRTDAPLGAYPLSALSVGTLCGWVLDRLMNRRRAASTSMRSMRLS